MKKLSKKETIDFKNIVTSKLGGTPSHILSNSISGVFEKYYTINYENQDLFSDISKFLKELGYKKIYFYPSLTYETKTELIDITELNINEVPEIYGRYIPDILLCPKDMSFVILHSHENFFTFAGSEKFVQKFMSMFPKYKKFEDKR